MRRSVVGRWDFLSNRKRGISRGARVRAGSLVLAVSGFAAAVAALLGAGPVVAALPAGCSQSGFTVSCTYTQGANAFVVPKGVSSVHIVAVGGEGANSYTDPGFSLSGIGGFGARVTGDVSVNAGDTLWAIVGGNGEVNVRGYNGGGYTGGFGAGGGGGGASDVRTSLSDLSSRLIVAGGGGGAGIPASDNGVGGAGGDAGQPGGGGTDLVPTGGVTSPGGGGGAAGTSSAGGSGGSASSPSGTAVNEPGCPGNDGTLGQGGDGGVSQNGTCLSGAGGGGGGLYGGGAGGGAGIGFGGFFGGSGGGGGGSSLVPAGGTFAIDATGTPEVVISYTTPDVVTPSSLAFGNQPLGSTSAPKTVTLSDTGSAPIAVNSVTIDGANPGDFAISSDTCSGQSVAPGSSCAAQITFAPAATGPRAATLSFTDDASDGPQTVDLSGTGTTLADVKVAVSGPGSARSGSQDTYAITVSNVGPSTALNVVMTAQVPTGTKFVAVSATQGNCSHPASGSTSGTITCSLGDLASGGAAINSMTLKITLTAKGGSVVLAANAYSTAINTTPATPDPNLSNNVASLNTTVTKK